MRGHRSSRGGHGQRGGPAAPSAPTPPITAEGQLELFRVAVALLGGTGPASRALPCEETRLAALSAGEHPLEPRVLEDISRALITHADACRRLERMISPAFAANLTEGQRGR